MTKAHFLSASGVAIAMALVGTEGAFAAPVLDDAPPTVLEAQGADLTSALGFGSLLRPSVDGNGVDLISGEYSQAVQEVSIGKPKDGGLSYTRTFVGTGWRDNLVGTIDASGSTYTVSMGGVSETFTLSSGVFTPEQGEATLTFNSGTNIYTYKTRNGTIAQFSKGLSGTTPYKASEGRLISVQSPAGELRIYHYVTATIGGTTYHRLQSVTNNLGYHLKIEYLSSSTASLSPWITISKVTGINGAIDYCSPTAATCSSLTVAWPSATFSDVSTTTQTVTDSAGGVLRYTYDVNGRIVGIKPPSSTSDTKTITYQTGTDQVASVQYPSGTWNYSYSGGSVTVTDPLSHTRTIASSGGQVTSDTDGLGHTVSYGYDSSGRLSTVTTPEGSSVGYQYDSRGNVIQTTASPKVGSGLSTLTESASYDATCVYLPKCNKPNSITDSSGKTTDFTYDNATGQLLTVTSPPPTSGASRPETRLTYAQNYAYYKDSSGTLAAASAPVSKLSSISACRTGSSCTGTVNETKTTLTYGSTGAPNNLLPTTSSVGAGDGSLTATSLFTYNSFGAIATVDGPLSGSTDITRFRYDAMSQLIGVVGPDPDGSGSLKHRAQRVTYDSNGKVVAEELGTVNSQSDADWAAFSPLYGLSVTYDASGRIIKEATVISGSTYDVVQYTYDAADRLECIARRKNPAVFSSLPTSACTLGTAGSYGPDEISRASYDAADRATQIVTGYGTAAASTQVSFGYSNNDRRTTLTDGSGNVTTFSYDGFDRLKKVRFPNASGGGSSTTDYEEYTYDAGFRITAVRRRDGNTQTSSYDDLGRLTTGPGGTTYTYDNFGNVTSAGASGGTHTFSYDPLSRLTAEASPWGTVGYQLDAIGRRTRLTWPDLFYVTYEYNAAGDMTAIKESGTTALATFGYDNLGRRVSLTYGNGSTSIYTYTATSALNSLVIDLNGSSGDQTLTLSRDAINRIVAKTSTNSNYTFTPPSSASTVDYDGNGLNQYTELNSAPLTYDAKGNLTSDQVNNFGYDTQNRLTSASGASLSYDRLGRLNQVVGSTTTGFLYDGRSLIAEYDGAGSLIRRYVHGPGANEPLVWIEAGSSPTRRYLIADDLGSISVIVDSSGNATAYNHYDSHGAPEASITGRFGFTGQVWIPETGLYYFRARMYSPTLGRFLQADPIGYGDGPNVYQYASNDPINRIDPGGLDSCDNPKPGDRCMESDEIPIQPTRKLPHGACYGDDWMCWNQWGSDVLERLTGYKYACPRGKAEGSFGAQFGAKGRVPGAEMTAKVDGGTVRGGVRAGYSGDRPGLYNRVTQGGGAALEVGHKGFGFRIGTVVEREAPDQLGGPDKGKYSEPGQGPRFGPWKDTDDNFYGFSNSFEFFAGWDVEAGWNLQNESCTQ